ncbi:Uclacyanin 1 [Bienertia sinuspersici]
MVCTKKTMMMVIMMMVGVYGGNRAEAQARAQAHHVVGDDRGWEVASDVASWAASRTFVVGDFLWFAYSTGLEKDSVVELNTKHEFESCDLSNPIKMYTNGLDKITLEEEGIRYFASSNPVSCKKGLKLPVEIKPKSTAVIQSSSSSSKADLAQEPTAPSSSTRMCGSTLVIIGAIIFYYIGI